jgi:tetratricopeptide (TPR) repeat protein
MLSSTVYRLPFTVYRLLFSVDRLPPAACRLLLLFCCSVLLLSTPSCSGDSEKIVEINDTIPTDLKALNERIAKDSNKAELYYERAQYFFAQRQIDPAIYDIKKAIVLDSTKVKYHLAMGDYHFAINKTRVTIESLKRALRQEPENTEVLLKLGELFYIVQKYDTAIYYVNRSLGKENFNSKAHFQKGMILKESGDTVNAVLAFQTSVEQDPKNYNAYVQLGQLQAIRNNPLALDYLENAINLNPKGTEARYFRAMFYQNNKDYKRAKAEYEEILKNDSLNTYVWFNLGYIAFNADKDYKAAQKYFDKSFNLNPNYADAVYMRGLCYESLGNKQLAAKDYNAAIIIRPDHDKAVEGLKRLKNK